MDSFLKLFTLKELRDRFLFTLFIVIIYRLGSHIPIAGIDVARLQADFFSQGGLLDFFNLFSGGALSRFSLFALGILPFINASIIMQMLTFVSPSLKDLAQEGVGGQKQISQYTRYLTILIAFFQSIVMSFGFKAYIVPGFSLPFFLLYSSIGLVAGAALVMWLSEVMTERGIGNGASILIFVGIISQLPFYIKNTAQLVASGVSITGVVAMIATLLVMILAIVYVQEAQRRVQIQYAKRVVGRKMYGGQNTYIPMRLVQGGVLPIIFASALLQFPLVISNLTSVPAIQNFFSQYYRYDGFLYNFFFCFLIFFFTYFYTAISFNPKELSDNIKKYGGFIMGVRPGSATVNYLEKVVSSLTLIGAIFLVSVALLPILAASLTKVTSFNGLGGTALLIIVGVAMDFVKQIETFLLSRKYDGFLE